MYLAAAGTITSHRCRDGHLDVCDYAALCRRLGGKDAGKGHLLPRSCIGRAVLFCSCAVDLVCGAVQKLPIRSCCQLQFRSVLFAFSKGSRVRKFCAAVRLIPCARSTKCGFLVGRNIFGSDHGGSHPGSRLCHLDLCAVKVVPFKSADGTLAAHKVVCSSIYIFSADFAELIVARPGLVPVARVVDLGRFDLHFCLGSLLRACIIHKQLAAFLTLVVFLYAGSDAGRSLAVDHFRAVSGREAEGDIHSVVF